MLFRSAQQRAEAELYQRQKDAEAKQFEAQREAEAQKAQAEAMRFEESRKQPVSGQSVRQRHLRSRQKVLRKQKPWKRRQKHMRSIIRLQ